MPDPEQIHRDLVAWNLVEDGAPIVWSRRLSGAVMDVALASWPAPEGAVLTPLHARFLLAVELAQLPDAVRRVLSG